MSAAEAVIAAGRRAGSGSFIAPSHFLLQFVIYFPHVDRPALPVECVVLSEQDVPAPSPILCFEVLYLNTPVSES